MPLPSPQKNEEQKPFVSRCVGNDSVVKEFPDQQQRIAVCFSQWRKSNKDSADNIERSFVFNLDYSKKSDFRVDEVTGFLHAKARLTRSGVLDYYDDDGNLYRELRPADEVFDKASMNSLGLKPITNDHPDSLVTVENIKNLQVGTIGENIEKDNEFLLSSIVITDKDMVQTIVNRKKTGLQTELSCGYSCKLVPDIGIHEKDGYYTFKQQNIRYNHVGIVDKARAGRQVRILDKKQTINNQNKEPKMPNKVQFTRKAINLDSLKMDAITQVVEEEGLQLANTLSNKLDEAVVVVTSLKKDKDELQGKFDQANETIKALQAKVDSLSDVNSPALMEMMKVRADVEKVAEALKVDCKDKDIKTIKCDCINATSSQKVDFEGKSDDYVNGRFDSVAKMITEQAKADGNNKFFNFMKHAVDGKPGNTNDPRATFINKDKDQNRK